jgi:hypothetical protein
MPGNCPPLPANCNVRLRWSLETVTKSVRRESGLLNTTRKIDYEVV